MALRKRAPGLICLLLITAAAILLAGRPISAAALPDPEDEEESNTLEEDSLYYEEQSPVRVISLTGLEPVDTAAQANPLPGTDGALCPVEAAEMAEILAELNLNDGTCIRLYATAEGLVFGAFSRADGQWTRFVQLWDGVGQMPDYTYGVTLTAFSDVLGQDGFLLRTDGDGSGCYEYRYYWLDQAGELQVLSAAMDPVTLDMDGDGRTELVYNFNERWDDFSFCYRRAGGEICRVTPAAYLDWEILTLERIESEGPGPARIVCSYQEGGQERFCAITFQNEELRVEWNIVYVPGERPEDAVTVPDALKEPWTAVSITGPDGWVMDGAGEPERAALRQFCPGAMVPTDAPLDESRAYTLTVTAAGEELVWTVDEEGICRLTGLEGNYRILRSGGGSPAGCFYELLEICCDASRTSRDYDAAGRYLGGT